MKTFRIVMWSMVLVLVGIRGYEYFGAQKSLQELMPNGRVLENPIAVTLEDTSMKTVLDSSARYKLVFFGFTNCPSACPLGMGTLKREYEALLENQKYVDAYFVSVDPERDTSEISDKYAKSYHPDFSGITLNADELDRVTRTFGAFARKSNPGEESHKSAGAYDMKHSTQVFVIQDKSIIAFYSTPMEVGHLTSDLRHVVLKRL